MDVCLQIFSEFFNVFCIFKMIDLIDHTQEQILYKSSPRPRAACVRDGDFWGLVRCVYRNQSIDCLVLEMNRLVFYSENQAQS